MKEEIKQINLQIKINKIWIILRNCNIFISMILIIKIKLYKPKLRKNKLKIQLEIKKIHLKIFKIMTKIKNNPNTLKILIILI